MFDRGEATFASKKKCFFSSHVQEKTKQQPTEKDQRKAKGREQKQLRFAFFAFMKSKRHMKAHEKTKVELFAQSISLFGRFKKHKCGKTRW